MDILDYSRCCRFCLQQDVVTKLILHSDIYELVSNCASVQISVDDGLPKQICMLCASELNRLIQFRNLCRKSDMMLRLIGNVMEELQSEKNEPVGNLVSENTQSNATFESDRNTSEAVLNTSQPTTTESKRPTTTEYPVMEPQLPRNELIAVEESLLRNILNTSPRSDGNINAVVISSSENSRDSDVVYVESSDPPEIDLRQRDARRKQTGKFNCECLQSFTTRGGLLRHKREVIHNKPKVTNVNLNLERCNICDQWFLCRANLEAHVIRQHVYNEKA